MKEMISAIIPLYNEAPNLHLLYKKLKSGLHKTNKPYEVIFVNDGSKDNSDSILKEIFEKDKENVVIINFRKNEGKAVALDTGIKYSKGDIIVTLDSDLQHDPEEIPLLIKRLDEGFDLVTGARKERRDAIGRIWFSKIVNLILFLLTGFKSKDFYCGFKAYRKEIVKELVPKKDIYRFIAYISYKRGYKVTETPITYHPRKFGKSKYGIKLFQRAFYDILIIILVLRARHNPLYFFGSLSLITVLLGIIINPILIYNMKISTIPLLIINTFIFQSIILFSLTGTILDAIHQNQISEKKIGDYPIKNILKM